MCSVVGYIGKNPCRSYVLEGLRRLEYRGYDSAGFACIDGASNRLLFEKAVGCLDNLEKKLAIKPIDGGLGVGHTRWATHGVASEANAHPHFDCKKSIAVVHNGIIENYHILKGVLEKEGHRFESTTDTEVIPHLLESLLATGLSYFEATLDLVMRLEGAYAFIALEAQRQQLLLVRKRSPLCIGIGDGERFVASDPLAFAGRCAKVIYLPDESFAYVYPDKIELYDFAGNPLELVVQECTLQWQGVENHGYRHFMLKEIYEQKKGIKATVAALNAVKDTIWDQLGLSVAQVGSLKSITLLGCGTSWHAGLIGKFFFESIVGLPTHVLMASEARYLSFFPDKETLYIAISQSGETADTLECLRLFNMHQLATIALSNVASSTMVREAKGFLLTQAGYEVAVVSTKAFTTQLVALYWLASCLALERKLITEQQFCQVETDLLVAGQVLESCIESYKEIIEREIASQYTGYDRMIFLGRHLSYPFALEAALKLKEIAYLFVMAYAAGELKHGPLALVERNMPVFIFSCSDRLIYKKLVGNAQEVKARGAHIVAFAFEGQDELVALADRSFIIPAVNPLLGPLAMAGVMQFLVYHMANIRGCPIDKPRNLAKSVTVE